MLSVSPKAFFSIVGRSTNIFFSGEQVKSFFVMLSLLCYINICLENVEAWLINENCQSPGVSGGGKNSTGPGKGTSTVSSGNAETGLAAVIPGLASITHTADVLDMPVDPNEPTYCLCHQVSYGEMIGCDNPDVRIHMLLLF